MAQPIRKGIKAGGSKPSKTKKTAKGKRKHPEYGTSKLEERFAANFRDRLGVEYVYQYRMESIGRYADFRIMPYGPIIEIQGSYWHGDDRLYEDKELNRIQKKSKRVDEVKRKWCSRNGIKLYCIWEKDINESPEKVLGFLREVLKDYISDSEKEKRKRH